MLTNSVSFFVTPVIVIFANNPSLYVITSIVPVSGAHLCLYFVEFRTTEIADEARDGRV